MAFLRLEDFNAYQRARNKDPLRREIYLIYRKNKYKEYREKPAFVEDARARAERNRKRKKEALNAIG